ncbi:MAG: response regulator [Candidatus Riflebacteria bacterium]|nr:response regulator [Candidatus Riflebacteria bacterium]
MDFKTRKMKVLIVEDDEASRQFMTTLIRDEGYDVMEAANGAEGLKCFESFQPELVFSDISMPIMDGLEMLEKIRKKSYDSIVVMTTAFGTAEYTLKALRLHANDYLVKPVLPQDVIANLKKYEDVLTTRSAEREVFGMILHRELTLQLGNLPGIVSKVVDRLMQETEGRIPAAERLSVHLGLLEIIMNAIEHGNLGINYTEKGEALEGESGDWNNLVSQRMSAAPYKDRSVLVQFQMDGECCEWTITDEGEGFDWQNVPDPNDPENLLAANGRGIMLARLSFDDLTYLGNGNQVVVRKNLPPI